MSTTVEQPAVQSPRSALFAVVVALLALTVVVGSFLLGQLLATPAGRDLLSPNVELLQVRPGVTLFDVVVRLILTAPILGASLYVILSRKYGEGSEKWAFGAVGLLIGYWLK